MAKNNEGDNESDKLDISIIDNIENYVKGMAGEKTLEDLIHLSTQLKTIKSIIETSYTIGDYVEKYEAYKQQLKSSDILQSITELMIPEFKEFVAAKFKETQELEKEKEKEIPK